jgi:hypothetical protein
MSSKPFVHYPSFLEDLKLVEQNVYRQTEIFSVDLSNVIASPVERPLRGNVLALLPRVYSDQANAILLSDTTARIFIRFNNPEAPAIPFSLIANSQDAAGFSGPFYRIFVTVPVAVANGRLHFVNLLGCGLSSLTGGINISPPFQPPPSGGGGGGG